MNRVFFVFFCFIFLSLSSQTLDSSLSLSFIKRNPTIHSANPPVLILMHGYGSNERDLYGLADKIPGKYMVYFLRAPISMGNDQYAWYPVEIAEGKRNYDSSKAENSRLAIIQFIEELKKKEGYKQTKILLGGFSQGGILSYSVGLTKPEILSGILVMSGRILDEVKFKIASAEKIQKLNIYISHGSKDNVLNVSFARQAALFLRDLRMIPIYREYLAGHMITDKMMIEITQWLNK